MHCFHLPDQLASNGKVPDMNQVGILRQKAVCFKEKLLIHSENENIISQRKKEVIYCHFSFHELKNTHISLTSK